MSNARHSYVAFYPSDWIAGTADLPRLYRSVYHDICCRIWDSAEPVPERKVRLLVADLTNGMDIVEDLVSDGKLERLPDGSLSNRRAMLEATKSQKAWEAMSSGGKKARSQKKGMGDAIPDPIPHCHNQNQNQNHNSSDAYASGADAPKNGAGLLPDSGPHPLPSRTGIADPRDWFFHPAVIAFVRSGGASEANARSMIGKLRKIGDGKAAQVIEKAFEEKVSDPISRMRAAIPAKPLTENFNEIDYGKGGRLADL